MSDDVRVQYVRTVRTQLIPGPKGTKGDKGDPGEQGIPFTVTMQDFVQPALNETVLVIVQNFAWAMLGMSVYIDGSGNYTFVGVNSSPSGMILRLDFAAASPGTVIEADTNVTVSGQIGPQGPQGEQGPPGTGGGGSTTFGGDLASSSSTTQQVVGIDGMLINHSTPAAGKTFVINPNTNQIDERRLTFDEIDPAFSVALSFASGGGIHECGTLINPTFNRTFTPNSTGITADDLSDGTTSVSVLGASNPLAYADTPHHVPAQNYTSNVPGTTITFTETTVRNGITKTGSVSTTLHQKAWWGVGTAGATGFNGTTGALVGATGTLTGVLDADGKVPFSPSPTNQKVLYAVDKFYDAGGTLVFKDRNNLTVTMLAPQSIVVATQFGGNRNFWLYESLQLLSTVDGPVVPQ